MTDRRVRHRIVYAAALSGAVHAGVIAVGRHEPGEPPTDLPPLAVRIVNVGPEAAPVTQPMRRPARATKPSKVAVAPRPSLPLPPEPSAPAQPEPEDIAAAAEVPAVETPAAETSPAAGAEPTVIATAPASTLATEKPALPTFPKSGRISYSVVYGRDQYPVGRTVQSWKIDGTRYQLASRSETIGLADLLRSQHRTYLSRGELTPE